MTHLDEELHDGKQSRYDRTTEITTAVLVKSTKQVDFRSGDAELKSLQVSGRVREWDDLGTRNL